MELYTAVATTALSDSFYESRNGRISRILELVDKVDSRFVAKLAIYARTEMHLRSVPLLLVCALAKKHNGDSLVADTVARVVCRADEIVELLNCYQLMNPAPFGQVKKLGKLSNQIREGLKLAFNKFDEYQFAKYDRKSSATTLRDALFLVHPTAKNAAQQEIFDKIASQSLTVPYTWETELSVLGQKHFETAEDKEQAVAEKWDELVSSNALGYMAMLRNMRNMLMNMSVSEETIYKVCSRIADPAQVVRSKQFPFRFVAAYNEISDMREFLCQKILNKNKEKN
ncbi:MAG: TROVE domain-containing protein [Prevotellaceae bacterium]|nr:TROVE domain-containing protein [Prevotellaceae bacterium]